MCNVFEKEKGLHNQIKICHTQKFKIGVRKIVPKNCWKSFVLEKLLWPGLFF